MPKFTIESTYRLPVYRHRTYEAATLDEACRMAIEDDEWEGAKEDYETSGPTYITGAWIGEDTAYEGDSLPIPDGTDESRERGAFEAWAKSEWTNGQSIPDLAWKGWQARAALSDPMPSAASNTAIEPRIHLVDPANNAMPLAAYLALKDAHAALKEAAAALAICHNEAPAEQKDIIHEWFDAARTASKAADPNKVIRDQWSKVGSPEMWAEVDRLRAINAEMLAVMKAFTAAAHAARDALNGAGLPCPASIALAAEKARNIIAEAEGR